jgi:hypothetical protein
VLTAELTKHLETAYDDLAKSGAKPEEPGRSAMVM